MSHFYKSLSWILFGAAVAAVGLALGLAPTASGDCTQYDECDISSYFAHGSQPDGKRHREYSPSRAMFARSLTPHSGVPENLFAGKRRWVDFSSVECPLGSPLPPEWNTKDWLSGPAYIDHGPWVDLEFHLDCVFRSAPPSE
ncbi:MAG: hypothetical protein WD872_15700 [Pirellulaceae bacterium]